MGTHGAGRSRRRSGHVSQPPADVSAHRPRPDSAAAEHGATLARGAFFNTLAFLASNLRGIFTLLVARLLGSAALGTFGLAWAATDVVSKIATCGFDTTATAFVAQIGRRRRPAADAADAARSRWRVSRLLALAALPVAFALGPAAGLSPELARATGVLMLALPGITLYRVSTALSRGRGAMHHDIYSRGLTESLGTAGGAAAGDRRRRRRAGAGGCGDRRHRRLGGRRVRAGAAAVSAGSAGAGGHRPGASAIDQALGAGRALHAAEHRDHADRRRHARPVRRARARTSRWRRSASTPARSASPADCEK